MLSKLAGVKLVGSKSLRSLYGLFYHMNCINISVKSCITRRNFKVFRMPFLSTQKFMQNFMIHVMTPGLQRISFAQKIGGYSSTLVTQKLCICGRNCEIKYVHVFFPEHFKLLHKWF